MTSPKTVVRSTCDPASANDVAVGTGSCSRDMATLMPMPITATARDGSAGIDTRSRRIPATFLSPPPSAAPSSSSSRSLGHFSRGSRSVARRTPSATASAAASGSSGQSSSSSTGSTTAEKVSALPGGVSQLPVQPSAAGGLVVGDHDGAGDGVCGGHGVRGVGTGQEGHRPGRTRRFREGGGIEG